MLPRSHRESIEGHGPPALLIIDDDLPSLRVISDFLADFDLAIATAGSREVGLGMLSETLPDLVLLDLEVPGLDGFDVMGRLRGLPGARDVPVVVLTAHADRESKVKGFELGALDYLTKPVDQAEVLARITAHIERGRLVRSLRTRLDHFQCRGGDVGIESESIEHSTMPPAQAAQVERAVDILRERLADPPPLDELACLVGMSQPTLPRLFHVLYGTTVYGYLRELRLVHAKRTLLEDPTRLVKTIALEVGYRDPSDLIRNFKNRYGMTPHQMRRMPPRQSD